MENDENKIILTCPHCEQFMLIHRNEINCAIFRHAAFKENYTQVNPHMPKDQCDHLIASDKVFGCAKPFKIICQDGKFSAIICDYI